MNFSFAMRASAPQDVLVQELAGEAVLLNLKTEQYFGLDPMGAKMWRALMAEPSIEKAFDRLLGEYEVEPELLRRDMTDLIDRLVSHGLVEVTAN
jgi:hypothetical protein